MISAELAAFIESGISALVGTRDDGFLPDCVRAMGVRVEAGGAELTVFLPEATCAVAVANLRRTGRVAACFTRVADHRSIQLKGRVLSIAAGDEKDRALIDRYRTGLAAEFGFVGVPLRIMARMNHWPVHAVRFKVESIYLQTPGPGAGSPLAAAPRKGRGGAG